MYIILMLYLELHNTVFNGSDGRAARAFASGARLAVADELYSGLITSRVKLMTLNLVLRASLLGAQH